LRDAALKKKHSKTAEEERFKGTVLGVPGDNPGAVDIWDKFAQHKRELKRRGSAVSITSGRVVKERSRRQSMASQRRRDSDISMRSAGP